MHGEIQLVLVLAVIFLFALVSRSITAKWLTAPMLFVGFGLLAGSTGLGWLVVDPGNETIRLLAEATLVVVLFADASRIRLTALRRNARLPLRLLGIGMPLTIALGTVVAWALFPTWSIWEAALAAAVLAPTDAALGQAVVSSAHVPEDIRQTLNVESGLNDGIALPIVLVFLALAASPDVSAASSLGFWVQQVTLGPLAGIVIGAGGGLLLRHARNANRALPEFVAVGGLVLAALCYLVAESIGGNGFMSAFVGGAAFGATSGSAYEAVHEFLEEEGQLLMLAVFLLLGCALAGPTLAAATGPGLLYAALSLTVVRGLPVALALLGTGSNRWTLLFLGWFGPRGLASILFGMLLIEGNALAAGNEVFNVVLLTVLGSVFLHGLTAAWGAEAYGAIVNQKPDADT